MKRPVPMPIIYTLRDYFVDLYNANAYWRALKRGARTLRGKDDHESANPNLQRDHMP